MHPDRYSDTIKDSEMLIDPDRDEYVFSAVKQIIDMELPILSICRGFQEMNVILEVPYISLLKMNPILRA